METYRVCWKRLASRLGRAWLAVSDGKRNVLLHLPPNVPALSQLFALRRHTPSKIILLTAELTLMILGKFKHSQAEWELVVEMYLWFWRLIPYTAFKETV